MKGDAETIAKGLTKAQVAALFGATDMMSNHGGYPFFVVQHTGEPWPAGIAQFLSVWKDRLTPLGLEVRRHLLEGDDNAEG